MKRPEKIIIWLSVDRQKQEPFIDHNGKPLINYTINLPYWLAKAYKPSYVKVEIRDRFLSFSDRQKEENYDETKAYVSANWSAKLTKLRKMNNNFMLVATTAMGMDWFRSMADYEHYHKELQQLNRKYLHSSVEPKP